MKIILLICLILHSSILKAQDWCINKSANFKNSYKINADRFTHSNKPQAMEMGQWQVESAVIFRNEYLQNSESINNTTITNNIYSNHSIRYSFIKNLDFNLIFNDLIFYTGNEVTEFGGASPYPRISVGTKYLLYASRQKIALKGQLSFPKKELGLQISPEFRVLYSIDISERLTNAINFGGIMIDRENKFLIFSIECDWYISKNTMLITEFYRNCSHLTLIPNINYFYLFGFGNYFRNSIFWYLTYENDFFEPYYLNNGRIDIGVVFSIKS